MSTHFDSHAESYREEVDRAISFVGQDVDFFAERKAQVLEDVARRLLGEPSRLSVLDVGCGIGLVDGHLTGAFGSVAGVDVSEAELAIARGHNPEVSYTASPQKGIPHDSGSFDVAFAACVLHHVGVADRPRFVEELRRVVRPGGLVVVFEHNPFNPLTRLVVRRVAFDAGVQLLSSRGVVALLERAGVERLHVVNTTFLPFRGRLSRGVEDRLSWLPIGAQYAVIGERGAS